MNYINEARKIITDCYAALKPSEQLRREAAEEQRQGHITEGYARELTKGADAEALQLRQAAGLKLAGLAQQYTDAAKAADMPDGQALQSGDYALLSANFPMSAEEYQWPDPLQPVRAAPHLCVCGQDAARRGGQGPCGPQS